MYFAYEITCGRGGFYFVSPSASAELFIMTAAKRAELHGYRKVNTRDFGGYS